LLHGADCGFARGKDVKVSVITVVYNNVDHVGDAINAVLEQNYPFVEYVVVDGGSTDGTVDVINKYRSQIAVFLSEPDNGIYDALNKGVSYASGDIIGFLHSDDLYAHSGVISSVVDYFHDYKINVMYGDLEYVKENEVDSVVRYWRAGSYSKMKLKCGWMPPHPTVYVYRSVYEKIGNFNLSYKISADYDYMLRLFSYEHVRVGYLPEVLVKMRLGGASNQSLSNLIRKSMEDYRALKSNRIGGVLALSWKNISKLPQFFKKSIF